MKATPEQLLKQKLVNTIVEQTDVSCAILATVDPKRIEICVSSGGTEENVKKLLGAMEERCRQMREGIELGIIHNTPAGECEKVPDLPHQDGEVQYGPI